MKNLKLYAENKDHHSSDTNRKSEKPHQSKPQDANRNKENNKPGKNTREASKKSSH